jgi:hypothetical protein
VLIRNASISRCSIFKFIATTKNCSHFLIIHFPYLQVYVPGVLACSALVEKGDKVAVSVAVEQPVEDGGWAVGITRGTILQGLQSGKLFVLAFIDYLS